MGMIERRGLTQDTLFVFIVDNGWTPGRQRMKKNPREFEHTHESKYSPFEDGLRTPILLRWDGHTRAATHEQLVGSVDLLPTVLDAIGRPAAAAAFAGRSLWPAAPGGAALEERPVFGEIYPGDASSLGHPSRDLAYCWVRAGRLQLIVPHARDGKPAWGGYLQEAALWDVVADPGEKSNLAGKPEHAADLKRLRRLLDAWWTPGDDSRVPKPRVTAKPSLWKPPARAPRVFPGHPGKAPELGNERGFDGAIPDGDLIKPALQSLSELHHT